MTTIIRKWGNSLGLRLPKAVTEQLDIGPGSTVEIKADKGRIVIEPAKPTYSLTQLLKGITPKNLHRETDTGPAQGNESW